MAFLPTPRNFSTAGAYALLIRLADTIALPDRCAAGSLAPGRYVYFGSAERRRGGFARAADAISTPKRKFTGTWTG